MSFIAPHNVRLPINPNYKLPSSLNFDLKILIQILNKFDDADIFRVLRCLWYFVRGKTTNQLVSSLTGLVSPRQMKYQSSQF